MMWKKAHIACLAALILGSQAWAQQVGPLRTSSEAASPCTCSHRDRVGRPGLCDQSPGRPEPTVRRGPEWTSRSRPERRPLPTRPSTSGLGYRRLSIPRTPTTNGASWGSRSARGSIRRERRLRDALHLQQRAHSGRDVSHVSAPNGAAQNYKTDQRMEDERVGSQHRGSHLSTRGRLVRKDRGESQRRNGGIRPRRLSVHGVGAAGVKRGRRVERTLPSGVVRSG